MKQIKYIVKIPLTTDEPIQYKEVKFKEKKDVCDFLNINTNTFTRISNGTLLCSHHNTKKFSDIKIEKIRVEKKEKKDKTKIEKISQSDQTKSYIQSLLDKTELIS